MKVNFNIPFAVWLFGALAVTTHAQQWVNVWNGVDMTGLYKSGSTTSTVTFDSGMIRANGANSYLATNAEYTHYRSRFEWRQNTNGGNSGFLYHIQQDRIWPVGFECQTGVGDAGSLWARGVRFNSTGTATTYSPTGAVQTQIGNDAVTSSFHFIRSSNPYLGDRLWNAFEIFVRNDSMEIQINNVVVMRAWRITASGTPLVRGKIALQIEGSPVDYRNWQVMDLSGAVPVFPNASKQNLKNLLTVQGMNVSVLSVGNHTLEVRDLLGEVLAHREGHGQAQYSFDELNQPGVYLLYLSSDEGYRAQKLKRE